MIGFSPSFLKYLKEDKWELKENSPKEAIKDFDKYNEEYIKEKKQIEIK